jgi:hypothetical protein
MLPVSAVILTLSTSKGKNPEELNAPQIRQNLSSTTMKVELN